MIPDQHLGEQVRHHHQELAAQAHLAHLAKAAKAAGIHRSLVARTWSSLGWLAHLVLWRHNESRPPEVASGSARLAAPHSGP